MIYPKIKRRRNRATTVGKCYICNLKIEVFSFSPNFDEISDCFLSFACTEHDEWCYKRTESRRAQAVARRWLGPHDHDPGTVAERDLHLDAVLQLGAVQHAGRHARQLHAPLERRHGRVVGE